MSSEGVSRKKRRRWIAGGLAVGLAISVFGITGAFADSGSSPSGSEPSTTPIKHLVVIFQENQSFDHYFGTYPHAANGPGEPAFSAAPGTPSVNGLTNELLTANPNAANPKRLSRGEALTCSQDHGYSDEQKAFDGGLMDKFVEFTAGGGCTDKSIVMDYFDGNTVTGLWNLAQHFSLSDNSFGTQFGPSTVGAINLVSGETHGSEVAASGVENGTVIGDPEPGYDLCARENGKGGVKMSGVNVGTIMSERGITWGWFQGGFAPTEVKDGVPICGATHKNIGGAEVVDYSPHHEPFQYYKSTANPEHLPPTSEAMIGHNDQANHQYDMAEFDEVVKHENLPAVSFLKAPEYQDGHPGYSDPLDEQAFIAEKLNELEGSGQWENTAVVIAYDDSDGWYDHVMSPIVTPSKSAADWLNGNDGKGTGLCGNVKDEAAPADRCGYGPRLPLLVISPYAKQNYVDNTLTDQSSVLRFIEENWQLGRIGEHEETPNTYSADYKAGTLNNMFNFEPGAAKAPKVFLDPSTGEVTGEEGGTEEEGGSEEEDDGGHEGGHDHGQGGDDDHGGWDGGSDDHGRGHHEKAHCAVAGHGRHVHVSCRVSGKGHGAVRYRIVRGRKVLGTSRASIKGTKANTTIKTRKTLAGKYTLLATVSRTDGIDALSKSVTLPGKGSVDLH